MFGYDSRNKRGVVQFASFFPNSTERGVDSVKSDARTFGWILDVSRVRTVTVGVEEFTRIASSATRNTRDGCCGPELTGFVTRLLCTVSSQSRASIARDLHQNVGDCNAFSQHCSGSC